MRKLQVSTSSSSPQGSHQVVQPPLPCPWLPGYHDAPKSREKKTHQSRACTGKVNRQLLCPGEACHMVPWQLGRVRHTSAPTLGVLRHLSSSKANHLLFQKSFRKTGFCKGHFSVYWVLRYLKPDHVHFSKIWGYSPGVTGPPISLGSRNLMYQVRDSYPLAEAGPCP